WRPAPSDQVACEHIKDVAGIDTVPVHYKGGGPAIQNLMSGQVQVMLIQGGGTIQQSIKSGKLVALAVSSPARSPFYPELPAIAETYPGFETESWVAMFAPAATPREIVERLHASLSRILADPGMPNRFELRGAHTVPRPPSARARLGRDEQG